MKKIPKIIINTSEAEKKFCETVIRKATNDISEAEKKFCKTARRKATYKTYFFNGAWGSGKTSFLKKSEEHGLHERKKCQKVPAGSGVWFGKMGDGKYSRILIKQKN